MKEIVSTVYKHNLSTLHVSTDKNFFSIDPSWGQGEDRAREADEQILIFYEYFIDTSISHINPHSIRPSIKHDAATLLLFHWMKPRWS